MTAAIQRVAHHFDDAQQQREAAELGMWAFLATEVLFFGGLLLGYAVYHYWYPWAFAAGSSHLDMWVGGVNTAVLLTSSLTMALAIHCVQGDRRGAAVRLLALTMLLGAVFLGIKAYEYHAKFQEHLVPGPHFRPRELVAHADDDTLATASQHRSEFFGDDPAIASPSANGPVELFFSFYFALTGLHAVHMMIGIGVVAAMLVQTARGRLHAGYDTPLEMTGLYWHFVDIVWIFLYPMLYLIH